MSNPWTMLFIAGFFEICLALGLKYSEGFTKVIPTLLTVIATLLSFYFLSRSLRVLPIGTAYAIWTSIGAAGTALCGVYLFGEIFSLYKVLFMIMIIGGVVGLKAVS